MNKSSCSTVTSEIWNLQRWTRALSHCGYPPVLKWELKRVSCRSRHLSVALLWFGHEKPHELSLCLGSGHVEAKLMGCVPGGSDELKPGSRGTVAPEHLSVLPGSWEHCETCFCSLYLKWRWTANSRIMWEFQTASLGKKDKLEPINFGRWGHKQFNPQAL